MGINGEVAPPAGTLLGKKNVPNPQGAKCQRCLQVGHWTYECKNKRKYVHRSSRSSMLNKRLNQVENEAQGIPGANKEAVSATVGKKKKKSSGSGSSSSSSDSEADSSSSEDSSDSDSSSSDSSSSSSSSSSSEESSSSSSSNSSESNSSSTHPNKVSKKKSKDKLKSTQSDIRRETTKDQGRKKETESDHHHKGRDSSKSSRLLEKPAHVDKHHDRRKSNREERSHHQRSSRKEQENQSPDRRHSSRKRGRDSSKSGDQDISHGHFSDEYDLAFKQNVIPEPRERYERRKISSLYWSKSAEEEERKLQAISEISKQQENEDRQRSEHDEYSQDSHRHSGVQDDTVDEYKKKNKNDHEHWSGENQVEKNYLEEGTHSKRFYENVELGRRRHKEQEPSVKSHHKELRYHPSSPVDMHLSHSPVELHHTGSPVEIQYHSGSPVETEIIKDNLEEEISSSYWSYEMERLRKHAGTHCDTERSPELSRKSGHKRKKHEIDEYCEEMNGSKMMENAFKEEEKEMKTDLNQYKSRKDEKKHHSKSKSHDVKKRKSDKRDVGSDFEKQIDYDDFDLQGRNDYERAPSPAYNAAGSDDEHYAKARKSKHKGKKAFSIESSDDGRPSPKRMKRPKSSPERKRENRKSHHSHR